MNLNDLKEKMKECFNCKCVALLYVLVIVTLALEICNYFRISEIDDILFQTNIKQANPQNRQVIKRKSNVKAESFIIDGFSFFERNVTKDDKYIITIRAPRNLQKEDVKLELPQDKKVLAVAFTVENKSKTPTAESIQVINFYREYALPENNARLGDIEYSIKRGKLEIIIPIKNVN